MNPWSAINFKQWIEDNRDSLKPPVKNKLVYQDTDFIIMVVGGPNQRKDYHYNETEEFFYQVEGDIVLKVIVDGEFKDIPIKEGDIFLLPPKIPHSPQRPEGSVGLVIEKQRPDGMKDGLQWYCDGCHKKLYDEYFTLTDIATQLPQVFKHFYDSEDHRTCDSCGHVMPAA